MTDAENKKPEKEQENTTYEYKDAGIKERHGKVPLWLWVVAAVLLIWGIYYTIKYW